LAVSGTPAARGGAVPGLSSAPIPLAEFGARADAQHTPSAPALSDDGQATLNAPLQSLRGQVGPDGLRVESTSVSEGGGVFGLTPVRLDKGGPAMDLPPGRVSLLERTAVLERSLLTATGDGLRQDFVVAQAPEGDGPLTLTLALTGASARTEGQGVALILPGGRQLMYHSLHITDAEGRILDGTLTAPDAQTLTIAVADAGARYPVTIDPTISDADWQVWNPDLPGANNVVYALLHDTANNRLVGGAFTAIGTVLANYILRAAKLSDFRPAHGGLKMAL
jgi:hypothetical protein